MKNIKKLAAALMAATMLFSLTGCMGGGKLGESKLKSAAKKSNYGVDPFDGCPIIYTDALKPFSTATTGEAYLVAGDFGYGFQANFPAGNDIQLKVDEVSLAEKDLVKLIGKQFVGMGVVAPFRFVKVVK